MEERKKYFCVVGPGKSGTTTLYNHIINNTQVAYYSWKETNFLIEPERFQHSFDNLRKSLTNYREGADIIDASPEYYGMPAKVERNIELVPRLEYEVIAIIGRRDPVDRLVSHIEHNISHGVEQRPLTQVLENILEDKLEDNDFYLMRHIRQEKTEVAFSRIFDRVYFFDVGVDGIDASDFLREQKIPAPESGLITKKMNQKYSPRFKILQRLDTRPPRLLRVFGRFFSTNFKQAVRNRLRRANKVEFHPIGNDQTYAKELAAQVIVKKELE